MSKFSIHNEVPVTMNYTLNNNNQKQQKSSIITTFKKLWPLMSDEKKNVFLAFFAIILNSGLNLAAPVIVGYAIDHYIQTKQFDGVVVTGAILLGIYSVAFVANYVQVRV